MDSTLVDAGWPWFAPAVLGAAPYYIFYDIRHGAFVACPGHLKELYLNRALEKAAGSERERQFMTWRRLIVCSSALAALSLGMPGALSYQRLDAAAPALEAVETNQPVHWTQGPTARGRDAASLRPNVIVILADDLGFNSLSLNGAGMSGGSVPTPNINAIAQEGVTFTNGYAGNATCAPSRAAIMTGRYATRFGFEFTPVFEGVQQLVWQTDKGQGVEAPGKPGAKAAKPVAAQAVPQEEITVAELLRQSGYHTVHIGKWHLGGGSGARPEERGFDESLGFMPGAAKYADDKDTDVERETNTGVEAKLYQFLSYSVQFNGSKSFKPNGYMTDYLTEGAVDAIRANRNRPFFMYLAYNAPHTPLEAPKADYDALPQIGDHATRVYMAMIRNLDRNVGRVLAELKAQGIDRNTLIVFTSDNGGANYVNIPDLNRPYRGWKATFFEGGVHVPFFMRWPARLAAGTTYAHPVAHVDIMGTAAGVAGTKLPSDRVIDGVDLIPYITGKGRGEPHKSLYWRSGGYSTLIAGGWKLQVDNTRKKTWLFDLRNDPTEQHDLASARPEKVRQLSGALARQNGEMVSPLWPSTGKGPVAIDHPESTPLAPGDDYATWEN